MARRADNTVNEMKCVFPAKSINEGLARLTVSSFIAQLDPPISVLSELKTAVSEAVTNCIVHAYRGATDKMKCPIYISATYTAGGILRIAVKDKGAGIADVSLARTPLYTSLHHRCGGGTKRHGVHGDGKLYRSGEDPLRTGKGNDGNFGKAF